MKQFVSHFPSVYNGKKSNCNSKDTMQIVVFWCSEQNV